MINRVLLQNVLSNGPNLLVNSPTSRLQRKQKDKRAGYKLRLVWTEEGMSLLDETSVVPDCIDILGKIQIVLELLILFQSDQVAVE
jgi:hypothetical protein